MEDQGGCKGQKMTSDPFTLLSSVELPAGMLAAGRLTRCVTAVIVLLVNKLIQPQHSVKTLQIKLRYECNDVISARFI